MSLFEKAIAKYITAVIKEVAPQLIETPKNTYTSSTSKNNTDTNQKNINNCNGYERRGNHNIKKYDPSIQYAAIANYKPSTLCVERLKSRFGPFIKAINVNSIVTVEDDLYKSNTGLFLLESRDLDNKILLGIINENEEILSKFHNSIYHQYVVNDWGNGDVDCEYIHYTPYENDIFDYSCLGDNFYLFGCLISTINKYGSNKKWSAIIDSCGKNTKKVYPIYTDMLVIKKLGLRRTLLREINIVKSLKNYTDDNLCEIVTTKSDNNITYLLPLNSQKAIECFCAEIEADLFGKESVDLRNIKGVIFDSICLNNELNDYYKNNCCSDQHKPSRNNIYMFYKEGIRYIPEFNTDNAIESTYNYEIDGKTEYNIINVFNVDITFRRILRDFNNNLKRAAFIDIANIKNKTIQLNDGQFIKNVNLMEMERNGNFYCYDSKNIGDTQLIYRIVNNSTFNACYYIFRGTVIDSKRNMYIPDVLLKISENEIALYNPIYQNIVDYTISISFGGKYSLPYQKHIKIDRSY